ncbi:MAG: DNA-directed RNA polymerase subunit omega [Syntrophobacterales bacterium]|nr:DNA-directed RNA polymerase subunit omega [Syntrophobacterales bacterium]
MARVTIEDCMKQINSRFALVHLAVRRVLQLRKGAKPLVESDNKEIVLALREIAAGKVTLENIELLEKAIATEAMLPSGRGYDRLEALQESFEEETRRFGEQEVTDLPEDSFHEEEPEEGPYDED